MQKIEPINSGKEIRWALNYILMLYLCKNSNTFTATRYGQVFAAFLKRITFLLQNFITPA